MLKTIAIVVVLLAATRRDQGAVYAAPSKVASGRDSEAGLANLKSLAER